MKIKPKLRFPEFDGEWEEKQLRAILEIGTGKSKVQSNESGKYNILGSTGIIGKSHTYDYEGDFILTARVGHYAGKLYKHAGKVNISDNTIYLFNFINKNFIYESLNVFKLEKLVFGSGQPLIKASDLKKLKIRVPVSKEQKKIGVFFSKLDRQIELEEQKLEKLEEQKKGYMQDIFSQQLRFKDENGNDYPEWKEKKIYDVVKYLSSKRSSNHYSENIINGEYPVYDAIREISRDINFDVEKSYISILKDGAGVGRLNLRPGKSSVIGTMGYILPQNIDINFLFYYLKTMNFSKYVIGSTIPHLYFKDYSKETILVPINKNEQIKIGSFLIKLDHIIENKVKKIEILKKRKQGFLQKMFV